MCSSLLVEKDMEYILWEYVVMDIDLSITPLSIPLSLAPLSLSLSG
jgi:hypothetical protein